MEKITMQFIYALKHGFQHTVEANAIKAISELTDTPEEHYQPYILNNVVQQMFRDYISTCDKPSYEIWLFFVYYNNCQDMTNALLITLQMTQVRDDNGYVNGFSEVEDDE